MGKKPAGRGFAFSMDALFAVMVAIISIAAVTSVVATTRTSTYSTIPLGRAAQDALTLMDKQEMLRAMFSQTDEDAQDALDSDFPAYIPVNMGAEVNITICTYNYPSPGFTCSRNFTKEVRGPPGDYTGAARRVFADPANNKFGLAVIRMWYK